MSGPIDKFEIIFEQNYTRIFRYLSLKADLQTAEDICQITFVKAMEELHTFRGESSVFTWLCHIASNTLKNEYRRRHRRTETAVNMSNMEHRFISVEFTKNVELRIDVTKALVKLNQLDREIISLYYDVGCTFKEIAEIVGMKISAVKNRLYRALARLKKDLHNWEAHKIMSIMDYISIVSKPTDRTDQKMYQDIMEYLDSYVDRICSRFNHRPTKKITIEVYPDLSAFHQAVHEPDAPGWFMGMIEQDTIKIASPLNPGPEHTYQSILKSIAHLFTMWLVQNINPAAPKWLYQGIGGYEAGLMTKDYVKESVAERVKQGDIPTLIELGDNTWDFGRMKGFQFCYLLCEFIYEKYGTDRLNRIIRSPSDFEGIFSCSAEQFQDQWKKRLNEQLG